MPPPPASRPNAAPAPCDTPEPAWLRPAVPALAALALFSMFSGPVCPYRQIRNGSMHAPSPR